MSRFDIDTPDCENGEGAVDIVVASRARDIGGFEVRRALPSKDRKMVGPFIFLDQMGPADFDPGDAMDVRPHPHIGLATVTYLYEGTIRHRDSLGYTQDIEPGALNLMIAGKGISHSERTPEELRESPRSLSGIQTWLVLPESKEDIDPSFEHHDASSLPVIEDGGASMRIILGTAYGEKAPGTTFTDTLYVDAALQPGTTIPLPDDHEERAVYVSQGSVVLDGETYEQGACVILIPSRSAQVTAGPQGARALIFGGAAADGPRHIWWNFVATSKERIEAAKEEWRRGDWDHGRFTLPPNDNQEFIPID